MLSCREGRKEEQKKKNALTNFGVFLHGKGALAVQNECDTIHGVLHMTEVAHRKKKKKKKTPQSDMEQKTENYWMDSLEDEVFLPHRMVGVPLGEGAGKIYFVQLNYAIRIALAANNVNCRKISGRADRD